MARSRCCFEKWMDLQKQDLSEIQQAQTLNPDDPQHLAELSQLADKAVLHYHAYMTERQNSAREDSSSYSSSPWCTSLESSLLWIAGCRPSMFIKLIHTLSGPGLQPPGSLTELVVSHETNGIPGGWAITSDQLKMVDDLQKRVIGEEERLISLVNGLQEDATDEMIIMDQCELTQVTNKGLDDHSESMAAMLVEADELRLSTVKEILVILMPMQAMDFLAASKKLHLCLRESGKEMDNQHGH